MERSGRDFPGGSIPKTVFVVLIYIFLDFMSITNAILYTIQLINNKYKINLIPA